MGINKGWETIIVTMRLCVGRISILFDLLVYFRIMVSIGKSIPNIQEGRPFQSAHLINFKILASTVDLGRGGE